MTKLLSPKHENYQALQRLTLNEGEAVVYIKLSFLRQTTLAGGDLDKIIDNLPAFFAIGTVEQIKKDFQTWLNQAATDYLQEEQAKRTSKPPA